MRVFIGVLIMVVLVASSPVSAQEAAFLSDSSSVPLHDDVFLVELSGSEYETAASALDALVLEFEAVSSGRLDSHKASLSIGLEIDSSKFQKSAVIADINKIGSDLSLLKKDFRSSQGSLRDLLVSSYTHGGLSKVSDSDSLSSSSNAHVASTVTENFVLKLESLGESIETLESSLLQKKDTRRELSDRIIVLEKNLLDAQQDFQNYDDQASVLSDSITEARSVSVEAGRLAMVSGFDFPAVVLSAALHAEDYASESGCNVPFYTLLGISKIESVHGTYQGSQVLSDGSTSVIIRGPALDGNRFALIYDTDNGVWDGDTVFDRAVGVMQFIPQTWARLGIDGDNDGFATPLDFDDAMISAAMYLCRTSKNVDPAASGFYNAVYSYNHSSKYVSSVRSQANEYSLLEFNASRDRPSESFLPEHRASFLVDFSFQDLEAGSISFQEFVKFLPDELQDFYTQLP